MSSRGSSHIKKNKVCQDCSASYEDIGSDSVIAVVCDGHGGDDYVRSDVGSKLGCAVAEKNIKNFLKNVAKDEFLVNADKMLNNLEASIINGWNEAIYMHWKSNPFNEAEIAVISEKARKKYIDEKRVESAYGTTMIAVAMTSEFWFGIHIGDGKCVVVDSESCFLQPIPWDEKCFLNATTSICDSKAIENFRHFYSEKLPAAVFVGSDGIDDCFQNDEQLNNLYKTVLYSFATSGFDEALTGLEEYLPRLSAKGSGDDVSIAAILDLDLIPQLDVVRTFDTEKEKTRVAENVKKETEKMETEKRRVEEEHARFQQRKREQLRENGEKETAEFTDNSVSFQEKMSEINFEETIPSPVAKQEKTYSELPVTEESNEHAEADKLEVQN
jgi:hypothetical protein